ncbi:MAG: DNA alkylation repair protein [Candidatus Marinimicrobia bacterium]|nr:DNA alkylation repair protein [Candidatus Neomarinimicrobiota bacterium]
MTKLIYASIILEFVKNANSTIAIGKQKYMKSKMPFYGIPNPIVKKLTNNQLKKFPINNNDEYKSLIKYIFHNAIHREEWYCGLHIAMKYKKYILEENLPLYLEIIKITQWWDIVDAVASNLVGPSIINSSQFRRYNNSWIINENMWIRRTAILSQLKYKSNTDEKLLYELILKCAHEKEFFIRKAIGWILREYSKTNPNSVMIFIDKNRNYLSNLSVREGTKKLVDFT